MNSFNYLKTIRLLPLGLAILMIAGLIFAPSVQAIVHLSNGGGGSGGSGEGDPLDANDYSGGGFDDDYQDNHGVLPSVIGGGIVIQRAASDGMMYIIVDFQGTIPVLRVIQVSNDVILLEDPNAR